MRQVKLGLLILIMDKQFLISTMPWVYYDHVILAHLPEVSWFDIVHIGY